METISLIGSGNAATHIGHALAKAGHRVNGVFSRTLAAAQALAGVLRCDATDNLETLPEADCYLFAVKDDALPGLAARWGTLHPDSLCLHTAGSVPMDIFEGKVKSYGVLYPMQTFSKTRPVNFHDIPCFIEANNPETLEKVTQLARSVSDQVYVLSSERRRWLHVAAVFACNFQTTATTSPHVCSKKRAYLPTRCFRSSMKPQPKFMNSRHARHKRVRLSASTRTSSAATNRCWPTLPYCGRYMN